MVKKERSSNFELMRIVLMLFIVMWHIIMHGHLIENCLRPSLTTFFVIIKYLIIVHVNSFVLLMGYFQISSKFKLSKILKLVLQVIFYSILCVLIGINMGWIKQYDITTFITKLLPSVISDYWFINIYIVVYLFSDYINKFLNRLTREEHRNFLIVSFIVLSLLPYFSGLNFYNNNGCSVVNFVFLYAIGSYIRMYSLKSTYHFKKFSINGYKLLMLFGFVLMAYLNYSFDLFGHSVSGMSNIFNLISSRIIATEHSYSPPFVIIQSICYFELFHYLNLKKFKIINFVSSCTFGIYLLHDNPFIKYDMFKLLHIDTGVFVSYKKIIVLFGGTILIFVIGLLIECIRKLLIFVIKRGKMYKIIKSKCKNLFYSFKYRINW